MTNSPKASAPAVSRRLRAEGINAVPLQRGADRQVAVSRIYGGCTVSIDDPLATRRGRTLEHVLDALRDYDTEVREHPELDHVAVYVTTRAA